MARYSYLDSLPAFDPEPGKIRNALLLSVLTWGIYFLWTGPRLWYQDATGLFSNHGPVAAAWPEHTAIASIFGYRPFTEWLAGHPQMFDAPFGSGFLADALGGLFLRVGLDHGPAMMLSGVVALLLLLVGLALFLRAALDTAGRAWVAATLLLAAGGLGFVEHVESVIAPLRVDEPSWTAFAQNVLALPPQYYGLQPGEGITLGNPVLWLLLPQRDLLLGTGLALMLLSVALLWYREGCSHVPYSAALLLGIGFGLLPAVYAPALAVSALLWLLMLAGCSGAWRHWLTIGVAAAAVALPLLWELHGDLARLLPAVSVHVGGLARPPSLATPPPWYEFWWINRGLFLPLAALALLFNRWWRSPVAQAGVLLFVLVNLLRLDPTLELDQELLMWSQLLLAVPLTALLVELRRVVPFGSLPAFLLVVALTATGALDLWRLGGLPPGLHRVWGPAELQAAEVMRVRTQTDDLVAHTPDLTGNWVAALTGRPVMLGDEAILERDGIPYHERRNQLLSLLAGGRGNETRLRDTAVRRVVFDRTADVYDPIGEAWYRENYPLLDRVGPYAVYSTLRWNTE